MLAIPSASSNPYVALLEGREVELKRRIGTPAGVLPLTGLLQLWELVPPRRVLSLLSVAASPRAHPLVRDYGRYLSAEVARRQGRREEAARLLRAAGFIPSWERCAPVGAVQGGRVTACGEGESSLLPGQAGPARWLPLRRPEHHPEIDLGFLVDEAKAALTSPGEPAGEAILLLRTRVVSVRGQQAALRLSAGGAWAVWVNGRAIAVSPHTRAGARTGAERFDQRAAGIWLRSGENELRLKGTLRQGLRLFARLTRPDGSRLRGISFVSGSGGGSREVARHRGARPPVTLGGWLCRRWPGTQGDPSVLRDVARYLQRLSPGDPCFPPLAAVARRWIERAPSVEVFLMSAELLDDHNQEREALEQTLRIDPGDLWALFRMASYHQVNRQIPQTLARLRELLQRAPGFYPAALMLAEIYRAVGLTELAARTLDAQLARHPHVGRVILARADHALGQDDLALAQELYERHLANNLDELYSRNTLATLALRRGDSAAALVHLRAAIQHHPRRLFLRKKSAQVLAGMGRLAAAVVECEAGLALDPRSSQLLEELGRLHHQAGRPRAAWRAWRRALALRPQNPELRAYLAHLNPRMGQGEAERYREDPAPVIAAARRQRGDDPAVVLLDLTATEVLPGGLSRTLRQRLVRVEREAGAARLAQYIIQYNPDRQMVTINAAKIHRAAGGVSLAAEEEISINEPWARMWYDLRARRLRFNGLRPGDLIEIEYLLEDVAPDNQFATYFGDLRYLAEDLPVRRFRYVLITPAARRFNIRHPRGRVRHEVAVKGARRIHSWTAQDLAKVVDEPEMPGWGELSDTIHISTYDRWDQVARWYWELVKNQQRAGPALVLEARRITRGLTTELEKIRAIHGFVTRQLRYVGLAFGIHGYKPYAATQVLNRKFGDCKDKSTLLISLLAQIGVDATLVLVRTRQQGRLADEPASLAPFDHAVVYVPGHQLYLDATAEFSGSGELPAQVQGVMALHINQGRGVLRFTPMTSAHANRVTQRDRYLLASHGPARMVREIEIRGTEAASWRRRYQVEEGRLQRFEKALNRSLGGVKVLKLEMGGLRRLEQPVKIRAEVQVQGVVRSVGPRRFVLPCSGHPSSLTRRWARLSRRRHDLLLPYPSSAARIIELRAPRGWRVSRLPAPRNLSTPLGTFRRQVERTGWGARVTLELELLRARISPADYGAFRQFLLQVDQLQREEVTFVR